MIIKTRTVNAILLENDDELLLKGIAEKRAAGWTTEQIASYYNIYLGQSITGAPDDTVGTIPKALYEAMMGWAPLEAAEQSSGVHDCIEYRGPEWYV